MPGRLGCRCEWGTTGPDISLSTIPYQTNIVEDGLIATSIGGTNTSYGPIQWLTWDAWPLQSKQPIVGVDGPKEFMYIPPSALVSFLVTTGAVTAVASEVTIDYESWDAHDQVQSFPIADATMAIGNRGVEVTLPVSATGRWLRPKNVTFVNTFDAVPHIAVQVALVWSTNGIVFTPGTVNRGIFTSVAGSAKTTLFPLAEPVEFQNSKLPWLATRTTAAAVLATNVTQVLNKGGTVLCGRFSPAYQNAWSVTTAAINALHPAEKAFLPLETGMYTYVPPSTDLQDFYDFTTTDTNNVPSIPAFNLANTAMYNVIQMGGSSVIETMALTVDWHIEFRTSSALFSIGTTTMSLEGLHQAQLALNELGWFFENPSHKSILTTLVDKTKKYVPQLISIINPTAGRFMKKAIRWADSRSLVQKPRGKYNRMKTTSAASSGILGPQQKKSPQGGGKGNSQKKKKGGLQMYLDSRK